MQLIPVNLGRMLGVLIFGLTACTEEAPQKNVYYPEAASSEARLMVLRCSRCHAAPQPKSHDAEKWPSVLQRMQVRMKSKGFPPLSNEELTIIQDYLQRHARPSEQ